ncbi:protein FAM149B1 isoform X4 [Rhinatrema bivittatum]|uniref:protein FAM149B1 isoform X4 n=1 Tax=Rhinatrema bivittatum TaxID=194408 RepID=UPI00112AA511|nr:protein FAM149B1 isoform X4 [Rhinatrema bivittatum]
MISRYRRKPVIQSPESHGFVKSDLEAHPLPERLVESSPGILSNESYYTGSECKSESEISGDSRCLTVAVADGRISWWNQQSCTGLSTEGSSVLSWGFDEFDGAATRQVQQIFQHIDELLYEQKTSILTTGLQEECQQWSACFPHLRIQGKQILIPAEDGYGWYFSNSSEISVSSNLSFALGMDSGREEELHEKSWALSWDREEKQGYPPISPLSCKKMAVFEHLFDDIWREVVCCTADLVHRHWEGSALDAERNDFSEGMSRVESFSPFHQFEPLPLLFPRVPTSKMPFIPSNLMNRPYGAGSGPQRNLNGLMIIHSIPLQQKNLSHMDKMQDCDEKIPVRSAPGVFLSSRAWPSRPLEHSTSSVSHSAQSSRRRNPPRTLHPISTNPSRSSTPKSLEEVVRGIRLPATTDQLPCSPAPLSRNNLLPPISSIDLERSSTLASRMQTPDIPFRRSYTVMDYATQSRSRKGSGGPGLPLHAPVRSQSRGAVLSRSRQGL